MTNFTQLGLAEPIAKALIAEGYETPTPIQLQAIPHVLAGRDLLGIAQTGTGKTAAFALPILDRLARDTRITPPQSVRALVLAPTRELAGQIAQSFRTYGQFIKPIVAPVFGGVPINKQIRQMMGGADIVVATPGRLIDLIERHALTLKNVEMLVIDEADQMMDLGFIHPLRKIAGMVPAKRQTLFFSATMPKAIAALSKQFLTDPAKVSVAPQASTVDRVNQSVTFLNQSEKQALLTMTLRDPSVRRTLVFTRTKHGADRVVRHLRGAGLEAAAIHGNKSQPQRERALKAFRSGHCGVLVATDIAARGIDVDGVSHVINFEIPNVPEQYVHRIGRTARAGAEGRAISFVAKDERAYLRDIERLTRMKVRVEQLPADFNSEAEKINALRPAPVERGPRPNRSKRPGQKRSGPKRVELARRYDGAGNGRPAKTNVLDHGALDFREERSGELNPGRRKPEQAQSKPGKHRRRKSKAATPGHRGNRTGANVQQGEQNTDGVISRGAKPAGQRVNGQKFIAKKPDGQKRRRRNRPANGRNGAGMQEAS